MKPSAPTSELAESESAIIAHLDYGRTEGYAARVARGIAGDDPTRQVKVLSTNEASKLLRPWLTA